MVARIIHAGLDRSLIRTANRYYVVLLSITPYDAYYPFSRLDGLYLQKKPTVAPNTGACDVMAGSNRSAKGIPA